MKQTTPVRWLNAAVMIFSAILVFNFAASAQAAAIKEYQRLLKISRYVEKIPADKQDKQPYRSYLKRNEKYIVYSEPAGQWMVRSDLFWDLQKKYAKYAIADKIAWTAAENGLPGECEGYVPCHFSVMRMTSGEYLLRYPNGKFVKSALQNAIASMSYIAEDVAREKKNYDFPTAESEKAAFIKDVRETRSIFARVSHPDAAKALAQLKIIEEGLK
jgi:hypothetical protein